MSGIVIGSFSYGSLGILGAIISVLLSVYVYIFLNQLENNCVIY